MVVIQLRLTASAENSRPMDGNAMFTEDPMKGVRKDAVAATSSTTRLSTEEDAPVWDTVPQV